MQLSDFRLVEAEDPLGGSYLALRAEDERGSVTLDFDLVTAAEDSPEGVRGFLVAEIAAHERAAA